MRTSFLSTALLISLLMAPVQQAAAQTRTGTTIALLDIEEVFQEYLRYKAMLDDVRKDEKALETMVRGKAKELTAMQNELRDYKPGTINYSQLDGKIAKLKADTTVESKLILDKDIDQDD